MRPRLLAREADQLDVLHGLLVVAGKQVVDLGQRPLAIGDLAGYPISLGREHRSGLGASDQDGGDVVRRGSDRAKPCDEHGGRELIGGVAPVTVAGVNDRRCEQSDLVVERDVETGNLHRRAKSPIISGRGRAVTCAASQAQVRSRRPRAGRR